MRFALIECVLISLPPTLSHAIEPLNLVPQKFKLFYKMFNIQSHFHLENSFTVKCQRHLKPFFISLFHCVESGGGVIKCNSYVHSHNVCIKSDAFCWPDALHIDIAYECDLNDGFCSRQTTDLPVAVVRPLPPPPPSSLLLSREHKRTAHIPLAFFFPLLPFRCVCVCCKP